MQQSRIGVALAATCLLFALGNRVQGQGQPWGWTDGFESYPPGKFYPGPRNNWIHGLGNHDYTIDATTSASGKQSLRLFGILGGCWGALIQRLINPAVKALPQDFFIEFAFRNGNEKLSGCHPSRLSVSLRTSPGWSSNLSHTLCWIDRTGQLFLADNKTPSATLPLLAWNHLKIRITQQPNQTVLLTYSLNQKLLSKVTVNAKANTKTGYILTLAVNEGSGWYDDVRVYPASGGTWNDLSGGSNCFGKVSPKASGTGGSIGTTARISITSAPPSAYCIIAISLLKIQAPFGGGQWAVATPFYPLSQGFTGGNPMIPGSGSYNASIAIPNSPIYKGFNVYIQGMFIDITHTPNLCISNGLKLGI